MPTESLAFNTAEDRGTTQILVVHSTLGTVVTYQMSEHYPYLWYRL